MSSSSSASYLPASPPPARVQQPGELGPPLIAVVGTTGAGKSDLAVHLARRLGAGEILNSDTLQVYKDVNIVTNKLPLADRLGVPHHLMDLKSVSDDAPYSVKEFERDAEQLIARLAAQGKPCVLVGGTHYYLQYLLWGDEKAASSLPPAEPIPLPPDLNLSSLSPTQLYALLTKLDPIAAKQWHPNDSRRVKRSIERYYQRGCIPLPLDQGDSDPAPLPLRHPTLVFWVHTDQPVLDQRLDKRVDEMVGRGLFAELWQLRLTLARSKKLRKQHQEAEADEDDASRGVEQAIGVKEFDGYCELVQSVARQVGVDIAAALQAPVNPTTNIEDCDPDPVVRAIKATPLNESLQSHIDQIDSLRTSSLETMKLATRRYARRQISWLRARLSPRIGRHPDMSHMLVLDTTHVQSAQAFIQSVVDPVVPIARAFMGAFTAQGGREKSQGEWKVDPVRLHPRAKALLKLGDGESPLPGKGGNMHCKVCDRSFQTRQEWEAHQGSRAHRRVVKQQRKEAARGAAYARDQPAMAKDQLDRRVEVDDGVDASPSVSLS